MANERDEAQATGQEPDHQEENWVMRSWTLFGLIALCIFALSVPARAQGFGKIVGTV